MRRNDDLLRRLLLNFEENPEPLLSFPFAPDDDLEDQRIYFHLRLLADEGMLDEIGAGLFCMTAQGHDFVEAVRDEAAWEWTKAAAEQVAGVNFSMLRDVAIGYVRQALGKLGVPLG